MIAHPAASCTAAIAAVERRPALVQPWARGDVDGDGLADRVAIARRPGTTCRFFVVVRTRYRTHAWPLRRFDRSPKPIEDAPFVQRLAQVDGRGPLEVVVQVGHGASVVTTDVFRARGRTLTQIRSSRLDGDFFGGGTIGTGSSGVRCGAGGLIVEVGVTYAPPRILRTYERVAGSQLRVVRRTRVHDNRLDQLTVNRDPFSVGCRGTPSHRAH